MELKLNSRQRDEYIQQLEELTRSRAKDSFRDFIDYIWKYKYEWNWHHRVLAEKLEAFYRGDITRMMVFAPPRHGKTELVSRLFVAWVLGVDADHKIIACSHTSSFANEVTRDVARIMKSDEYAAIFPDSSLNVRGQDRNENKLTGHTFDIPGGSGSYSAAGAGGSILGKGTGILILDDIIKSAEHAGSKTQRDKLSVWYGRDALTRLNHPGGKVLIINTRQHEDDICGRLVEKAKRDKHADQWEVVSFPAINDEGKALWEKRFPLEVLMGIKAELNSSAWASLYQQTPTAQEGNIFRRTWFQMYDHSEEMKGTVNFTVDSAYGTDVSADATAIIAYMKIGANMYVIASAAVRMEFPDVIKFIPAWVRDHGYTHQSKVAIEPKASGVSIFQELKRNTGLNIIKDKAPTDAKEVRAQASTAKIESGRVLFNRFGEGIGELIDECCGFPGAKNDDRMDTLIMAVRLSFRHSALRMRGRSA